MCRYKVWTKVISSLLHNNQLSKFTHISVQFAKLVIFLQLFPIQWNSNSKNFSLLHFNAAAFWCKQLLVSKVAIIWWHCSQYKTSLLADKRVEYSQPLAIHFKTVVGNGQSNLLYSAAVWWPLPLSFYQKMAVFK
jgi:hypothetical protein